MPEIIAEMNARPGRGQRCAWINARDHRRDKWPTWERSAMCMWRYFTQSGSVSLSSTYVEGAGSRADQARGRGAGAAAVVHAGGAGCAVNGALCMERCEWRGVGAPPSRWTCCCCRRTCTCTARRGRRADHAPSPAPPAARSGARGGGGWPAGRGIMSISPIMMIICQDVF